MIVVLDTNVLVSAMLSPFGPAARILEMALAGDLQLAYDDRILFEYREVLSRPRFGFGPDDVADLLESLQSGGISVLAQPLRQTLPDPTDQAFLEVAALSDASVVTGNRRHFPAELCNPVHVFSPAEFLVWWQEHEGQ